MQIKRYLQDERTCSSCLTRDTECVWKQESGLVRNLKSKIKNIITRYLLTGSRELLFFLLPYGYSDCGNKKSFSRRGKKRQNEDIDCEVLTRDKRACPSGP